MKFAPTSPNAKRARAAFTLAEVLAALLFMAIVIPVALQGLRIASLAGQVGERKAVAGRVAERVLSEFVVTGTLSSGAQSGTIMEGVYEYQWTVESTTWPEASEVQLTTARVVYQVQGNQYEVTVSTLMEAAAL